MDQSKKRFSLGVKSIIKKNTQQLVAAGKAIHDQSDFFRLVMNKKSAETEKINVKNQLQNNRLLRGVDLEKDDNLNVIFKIDKNFRMLVDEQDKNYLRNKVNFQRQKAKMEQMHSSKPYL